MDDETAEIELLQQNLQKTRQLSKRMTSILDTFDTRIARLEKSILPLYTAAQILNKRRNNIDQTLLKIDDVASNQSDLSNEEGLILRGPQPGQLTVYKDALERLNANIAFKGEDKDVDKIANLVETGAKKLTQLYTKVVAEGSSGTTPAPGTSDAIMLTSFPASLLPSLSPVVKFLRTLPLPSTHPSHPAAQAILKTLMEAQRGYADMRGSWAVKCLDGQGKRLVVRANEVDPLVTGREFGEWVELILGTAEEEYKLLQELSPLSSPGSMSAAFSVLLVPVLRLFNTILSSLITLTKKNLQKFSFLALSAYEVLLSLQYHWEEILSCASEQLRDKNEFKDGLPALRSLCLRSFPEFLVDLKLGATSRGQADTSTKIMDFVVETVTYISKIPEVQGAVSAALTALGDGNWKMGEGIQVGVNNRIGDGDEDAILKHFIYDVVATAITSLTTISRTARRPAYGSIFLLNNVSYLRAFLLDDPRSNSIPKLLSSSAKDLLNSNYRTAKAGYFDANFSPLMQAMTDDPKDRSGKSAAKEKFTRFFDLFDEVIERHRIGRVMEDDDDGRRAVGDEVIMLVVPSLQRFIQKQKERDFSKNPQKYIKRTPEDIESQIRNVFS
ncbi:exocyst complex component, exo70 subunit [Coprinopsis marcescibilis]|uniref:Exocyst complex protein EXO70 n=1 Tax=Coprinopsis marcescibilis TaxID=230819 RepID=A0A5C3KFV7_COPMA|nr:exocyst complex component, exo70 subunit [Coprinopsis marcescibilis]